MRKLPLNQAHQRAMLGLEPDEDDFEEEELSRGELEEQIHRLNAEIFQKYETAEWARIREKLLEEERVTINAMMGCPSEELVPLRERVRTLRYLGADERTMRGNLARLVARLATLDEGA